MNLKILQQISEVCLYHFNCNSLYPAESSKDSNRYIPKSAAEEGLLASMLLLSQESISDLSILDDLIFTLGIQNRSKHSIKVCFFYYLNII